ncbi:MAG: hypothetical protein AABZ55_10180, partial [Bdellovibrionota bacterium]
AAGKNPVAQPEGKFSARGELRSIVENESRPGLGGAGTQSGGPSRLIASREVEIGFRGEGIQIDYTAPDPFLEMIKRGLKRGLCYYGATSPAGPSMLGVPLGETPFDFESAFESFQTCGNII